MKKTYKIALAMTGFMLVWMLSGVFKDERKANTGAEEVTQAERELTKVRVRHISVSQQVTEVTLRGRTEAKRVVDVKAETSGRLQTSSSRKGQQVKAGQVICELAENGRRAQLSQAQAAYDKARIDFDGATTLKKKALLSDTQLAASKAALESSRAALALATLEVEHLSITAPFDGVIEELPFEMGALMDRGAVCARLMDEKIMLVTSQASEKEVLQLVLGNSVNVRLISGEVLTGEISFIARVADPLMRSYRVEATLKVEDHHALRDGITAYMRVPLQPVSAHLIASSVLALDDVGRVGVRTVNADDRVEFHYVDIVREDNGGVWVAGLPAEVDLITVGQEFVANGDKVAVTREAQTAEKVSTEAALPQSSSAPLHR